MDNIRGFLGIRRMDMVPNAQIMEVCRVTKGVEKWIDGVLHRFSHVERMKNYRIAKKVYVGEYDGSHSVCRPQKRWIDTMKDYLRKRGLDLRQARRIMVYDNNDEMPQLWFATAI